MMRVTYTKLLVYWAIALLALSQQTVRAQGTATFEATGPTKEVPEGSRFEVAFSLKNTFAKRFIPPDFSGFQVVGGPSEMRGSGFVNGKSYSHQTWTYELEAGAPGSYTIGLATVQTDNQTLRSQPLVIRVGKARTNNLGLPAGSDTRLFIRAELDCETAWVGQQVRYQIKLYTQVGISDYDILDMPKFDGFYAQERQRFDTRTQYQTIKGKKYATRILQETSLFPQQSGDLRIGPARVRLGVDQPGSLRSLFGSKPELLQTQPLKIRIKPLPEPAPANFSGAVGQYNWQVSADGDSLSTDDALSLTVVVEGNGDARRFANPIFTLPDGLEGFEPKIQQQEVYETGEQFVHARTLEYVILPRQPGSYTLSPELVIFDPDSSKYRSLFAAAPITLHVTAGKFYGQQTTPLDSIASIPTPPPSPLAAIWQTTTEWLRMPLTWISLLGLALLIGLIFWWRRRARRPRPVKTKTVEAEPKPSLKTMRGKMKKVGQMAGEADARAFYHELLKVIQENVAMHLGIEPVLLTNEIMQAKLHERQVPAPIIDALTQVWKKCEQVVFASQEPSVSMNAVWQQADIALHQLDATMK